MVLAELTGVYRNLIKDYLVYLERVGLIMQLRESTSGVRLLEKTEKLFLQNTNLMKVISQRGADIGNERETFFMNQMLVKHNVVASSVADFMIGDGTFEVGGQDKTSRQIADVRNAYLVKNDIEYGYRNVIPLWQFGFNY